MRHRLFLILILALLLPGLPLQAAEPAFDDARYNAALQKYRTVLKTDNKNETARQGLVELAITFILGAEQLYSIAQPKKARTVLQRVAKELPDTLWRIGHLASKDDHRAQLAMGLLHKYGVLVKKDSTKACAYFTEARGRNIPAADYHGALCLPEENSAMSLSIAFMQAAARGGHAEAQELLAYSCMHALQRDIPCVLEWAGKAAAQGRPRAASLLGWVYSEGIGVKPDNTKALSYYLAAANAGDVAAMNNLGEFYETGVAGSKDIPRALHWYENAADMGFAPAQLNLGRLYASGAPGLAADPKRARQWLDKAEAGGLVKQARAVRDWLDKQLAAGKNAE